MISFECSEHGGIAGYHLFVDVQWEILASQTIGEEDTKTGKLTSCGFCYESVNLLKGANITSAQLRMPVAHPPDGNPTEVEIDIFYEDIDSAAMFSTQTDYDARIKSATKIRTTLKYTHTGHYVDPDEPEIVWDEHVINVDVTSLVQEVVNRPGWAAGGNIAFFFEPVAAAGWGFRIAGTINEGYTNSDIIFFMDVEAGDPVSFTRITLPKLSMSSKLYGTHQVNAPPDVQILCPPIAMLTSADVTCHTYFSMVQPESYSVTLSGERLVSYTQETVPPFALSMLMAGEKPLKGFSIADTQNIYLFCITGYQNGLPDITVPMSSFQARLRSGEKSYLTVSIPGLDFSSDIAARSNGDIRIIMAQVRDGEIVNSEEIARVHMDYIRIDEGSVNKSITLSGHRAETFTPKAITLGDATYKSVTNGKHRARFAEPNIYLKPGDVVTVDGIPIVADLITYYMSVEQQQMEISET